MEKPETHSWQPDQKLIQPTTEEMILRLNSKNHLEEDKVPASVVTAEEVITHQIQIRGPTTGLASGQTEEEPTTRLKEERQIPEKRTDIPEVEAIGLEEDLLMKENWKEKIRGERKKKKKKGGRS